MLILKKVFRRRRIDVKNSFTIINNLSESIYIAYNSRFIFKMYNIYRLYEYINLANNIKLFNAFNDFVRSVIHFKFIPEQIKFYIQN